MPSPARTGRGWECGKVYRSTLPPFEYVSARSIPEVISVLARGKGAAAILAGGTDLVVRMKMERAAPRTIVDVKRVAALGGPIRLSGKSVVIPPLATLAGIEHDRLLRRTLPVLARTALLMASPQVRNRATVGGNLANAAPSADMAPPLLALGARVRVHGRRGTRTIPLEEFFTGPGRTVLDGSSVLGSILVPVPPRGARAAYHAFTVREAMDLSVASAAAYVEREGRTVVAARIALGAVAPVPMRVPMAEAEILGTRGDEASIERAAVAASISCSPITDVRASDAYRRWIVHVVVRRALREVLS